MGVLLEKSLILQLALKLDLKDYNISLFTDCPFHVFICPFIEFLRFVVFQWLEQQFDRVSSSYTITFVP